MAHEYRYPLTRVCLRGGNMTLPRTMIGLFPDDGTVTMVDSLTGAEHEAYMSGPRVVSGLGELYREHGLDVNDELIVSRLSDARFSITPVVRAEMEAAAAAEAGADESSDEVDAGAEVGASAGADEAEPQAAEPHIAEDDSAADDAAIATAAGPTAGTADGVPEGADRGGADRGGADRDGRVTEGAGTFGAGTEDAESDAAETDDAETDAAAPMGAYDRYMQEAAEQEANAAAEPQAHAQGGRPEHPSLDPRLAVREAESALTELESEGARSEHARTDGAGSEGPGSPEATAGNLQQGTFWDAGGRGERAAPAGADETGAATGDAPTTPANTAPGPAGPLAPAASDGSAQPRTPGAQVTGAHAPGAQTPGARPTRGPTYQDAEEDAAALAAVALSSRLRRAFTRIGYRIEPLATGVLFLHAEMGRRRYKVLVQLLRSRERLDWAGLLSHRRNSPANYLAVVGDHVDLIRLSHPAELARATLWSWEALDRLEELHGSVPVTPLDLESHFARDGLFEQGLKRFEHGVAARVAERGAASEVLTRLARLKAPAVFLLEELAQDVNLSRDVVLRILDRFAEAPMHLVAKVDSGEFLLRQSVDTALAALAAYAESLRQRLPVGRREVITGLDDSDLGADLLAAESVAEPAEPAEPESADEHVAD